MPVKTYVTKPVTIEACQWEGGNFNEIEEFTGDNNIVWIEGGDLKIATLEGVMTASVQDYVIKGDKVIFLTERASGEVILISNKKN